jgi:hypothetical protein
MAANVEGNPALELDLIGWAMTASLLVRGYVAGTEFEPVKATPAIYRSQVQLPAGPFPSLFGLDNFP